MTVFGPDGKLYETSFRLARAPFGLWNAQAMLHSILGILSREKLGIEVVYTDAIDEWMTMLMMMNCAGYDGYTCAEQPTTLEAAERLVAQGLKRFPDALPDVFATLEHWPFAWVEIGVDERQIEQGNVLQYGSTGFVGEQPCGSCLRWQHEYSQK